MNRRRFLATALGATLAAELDPFSVRADDAAPRARWRTFEITTRVSLLDSTGPAQLWLPLAQTAGDYQAVVDLKLQGGNAAVTHDDRYGAPILRATWDNANAPQEVEAVQTVATRDRSATPFAPLTQAERQWWTAPTAGGPTDGLVRATADRITAGQATPRAKLRAIYDWVVDHTHRDPDVPGCGTGDIRQGLASGDLGGKCADINGLMVGLARAAGFPAREVYGLRVANSSLYPCLGRSGDVSRAQHCRAEVYLDQEGWFPLDPADVRKVVLEQKLALDNPAVQALRDRLFGYWEMNWIGYNSATDIELPGMPGKPDFSFLMYPCAVTSQGHAPCLDPARFHYEITARELVT